LNSPCDRSARPFGRSRDQYENQTLHECLIPWAELGEKQRDKDRNAIRRMPRLLKDAGIALVRSDSVGTGGATGRAPQGEERKAQRRRGKRNSRALGAFGSS